MESEYGLEGPKGFIELHNGRASYAQNAYV